MHHMETVKIQIPDEIAVRLSDAAQKLGLTVESLLQASIEEKLARLDEDFRSAADYVLEKNAELYRRLA